MTLDDRLGWFLLGVLIGSILGYITRSLRLQKEELDEVRDALVKDEKGFVRYPIVMDVALLLVVVFTVWASFASQRASNDLKDTQKDVARIAVCTSTVLSQALEALDERTTYAGEQATSNIELQKAQAQFLGVLLQEPPAQEKNRKNAANRYLNAVTDFVGTNTLAREKIQNYPYPTTDELSRCLNEE